MALEAELALVPRHLAKEHASRKERRAAASRAKSGREADDAAANPIDRFMLRSEVISATGLSDTTLWREYRAGRFPKPIPLTKNRVGCLESQVRSWIADRLQAAQAG